MVEIGVLTLGGFQDSVKMSSVNLWSISAQIFIAYLCQLNADLEQFTA